MREGLLAELRRWAEDVNAAYDDGGYAAGDGPVAPDPDDVLALVDEIQSLRKAVRVAISVTENCCGCIYISDTDGKVYALRGEDEIPELTAALGSKEEKKELPTK